MHAVCAAVPRVLPASGSWRAARAQGAKGGTCSCPWDKSEAINLFSLLALLWQGMSNTTAAVQGAVGFYTVLLCGVSRLPVAFQGETKVGVDLQELSSACHSKHQSQVGAGGDEGASNTAAQARLDSSLAAFSTTYHCCLNLLRPSPFFSCRCPCKATAEHGTRSRCLVTSTRLV